MSKERKTGKLVIITAPSGGGKEVAMLGLIEEHGYGRVVTCTAGREMRRGEVDGVDYHFLSTDDFKKSIDNDEFFEWYPYYETLKGTKKGELQRAKNEILLWRIDPETAANAKDLLRSKGLDEIADNTITIYIGVPEVRSLYRRQTERDAKTTRDIALTRMRGDWEKWKKYKDKYDFVVMNKDGELEKTIAMVNDIIVRQTNS